MKLKAYPRKRLALSQKSMMSLISPGSRVLEMGCAMGFMTRHLVEQLGCRVTGIEINPEEAVKAEQYAERVIVGDLTDPRTWESIEGTYDYVLYADVLEHLVYPSEALHRTKNVLNENGSVIASIPNVAHYKIRLGLLRGRFDYTDYGILDDSHLRFFTQKTARALFTENDYKIDKLVPICWSWTKRWLTGPFPNAFASQFVIQASPVTANEHG